MRRRLKKVQKTKPSDYPQLAFRVTEKEKEDLMALVDSVVDSYNNELGKAQEKGQRLDERSYRKNDIIIEALNIGLNQMKKKKK